MACSWWFPYNIFFYRFLNLPVYISPLEYFCLQDVDPCPPISVPVVAPKPAPTDPNLNDVPRFLYAFPPSILQMECVSLQ